MYTPTYIHIPCYTSFTCRVLWCWRPDGSGNNDALSISWSPPADCMGSPLSTRLPLRIMTELRSELIRPGNVIYTNNTLTDILITKKQHCCFDTSMVTTVALQQSWEALKRKYIECFQNYSNVYLLSSGYSSNNNYYYCLRKDLKEATWMCYWVTLVM